MRKSKQIIITETMDKIIHGSGDTNARINYNKAIRSILNKYKAIIDSTILPLKISEIEEIESIYKAYSKDKVYKMDDNIEREIAYFAVMLNGKIAESLYEKCANMSVVEIIKLFSLMELK